MVLSFLLFSDQPTYGGYDYQFVGTTPSDYTCPICTKVVRDAHLTVCCGQYFCASCLTHWLGTQQGRKTCPHCRQEDFQHVPNKAIVRKVNELKIRCTNHREGCGWVGELGGLKSHLDSDKGCGYVEVTCTNKGCGERVNRKDLQTHSQEECYYRPYECEYCGHKDTYTAITGEIGSRKHTQMSRSSFCRSRRCIKNQNHYTECPEYPLACPNRCGVTGIRRRAMPDHCSSCPLEPLHCPLEGCGERVNRKDLQTHLQEECYYRPYECEHCGHKDTYTAITGKQVQKKAVQSHYSECPEYPLACPNRCGVTGIRRRAMPDHHSSCPLEPLDCPFKDAGCTEKIARKGMEDHMTANQQKHMLLTFQSLQRSNQYIKQELHAAKQELHVTTQELHDTRKELQQTKQELQHSSRQREMDQQELWLLRDSIRTEIDGLEEEVKNSYDTHCRYIAQQLSCVKSRIQVSLEHSRNTLLIHVIDFLQLRKEKRAWHSPPFSIDNRVRVRLAVYPSGVGRGQGSHVSVSLILVEVVEKRKDMFLEYNVSVTAKGQHTSAIPKELELCTYRKVNNDIHLPLCSAYFPFPSPEEVLQSEELFLETEEANSLLVNESFTLELKLLKHQHHWQ